MFFLVSHAPGRLLPTIRSRCRRLEFQQLEDDAMTSILDASGPALSAAERQRIVAASFGSAGEGAGLCRAGARPSSRMQRCAILRQGDPTNARRSELATELGKKAAADRYAAFLDLAPSLIAREARALEVAGASARWMLTPRRASLPPSRPGVSLDPAATVFQIGGILAEVADPSLKR